MKVYPGANRTIAVDGAPSVPAAGSRWHIPAGISETPAMPAAGSPWGNSGPGIVPRLEYALTPPAGGAWDHYDAALFVLHKGEVQEAYRFTTYTSRRQAGDQLSSIRGNRRYVYSSIRSSGDGATFRNFNFQVVDGASSLNGLVFNTAADRVSDARFYFATQVPPGGTDPVPHVTSLGGNQHIRFHQGSHGPGASGTGSAACNVSPDFPLFRNLLVKLYEQDFKEFYGVAYADVDPEVHKLNLSDGAVAKQSLAHRTSDRGHADKQAADTMHASAQALFNTAGANGLADTDWEIKLRGNVWIIRPDEPPIS